MVNLPRNRQWMSCREAMSQTAHSAAMRLHCMVAHVVGFTGTMHSDFHCIRIIEAEQLPTSLRPHQVPPCWPSPCGIGISDVRWQHRGLEWKAQYVGSCIHVPSFAPKQNRCGNWVFWQCLDNGTCHHSLEPISYPLAYRYCR